MKSLILRDAMPEDSRVARELIYFAGKSFFNHTFGFGGNKEKALEFIEYAFRKEVGTFSHKFAGIAQLDDKVVGLELSYNGKTKKVQDKIVEKQIIKYYNFFQLVRLFGRGQHVKRFFMDASLWMLLYGCPRRYIFWQVSPWYPRPGKVVSALNRSKMFSIKSQGKFHYVLASKSMSFSSA